jgi:hypothetical protein
MASFVRLENSGEHIDLTIADRGIEFVWGGLPTREVFTFFQEQLTKLCGPVKGKLVLEYIYIRNSPENINKEDTLLPRLGPIFAEFQRSRTFPVEIITTER